MDERRRLALLGVALGLVFALMRASRLSAGDVGGGPGASALLETDDGLVNLASQPHSQPRARDDVVATQAWTVEDAYVESEMQALGLLALSVVGEHAPDAGADAAATSASDSKAADCSTCSKAPYYIDPSCASLCLLKPGHGGPHARRRCWLCMHWAVSLVSDVEPDAAHGREVLQLPILTHVAELASLALKADAAGIERMYSRLEADHGKQIVDDIDARLVALERLPIYASTGPAASGAGGGMGLTVTCNGTKRLEVGGGGGQGVGVQGPTSDKTITVGGGKGAGLQVFDAEGTQLATFGGGAGGGRTVTHAMDAAVNATSVSYGSAPDSDAQAVPQALLDDFRRDMRACWRSGGLVVSGGGGMGGGVSGPGVTPAHGQLAFRFESVRHPCPVSCLLSQGGSKVLPELLSPPTQPPVDAACDYGVVQNATLHCVQACDGRTFQSCLCPCFAKAFRDEMHCHWAKAMHCTSSSPQTLK